MNDANEAIKSIEEHAALNYAGWDSYSATPIAPDTVARARALVEALRHLDCASFNPCPGADGSIGFEICWQDGRELWIDIQPADQPTQAYIPTAAVWRG